MLEDIGAGLGHAARTLVESSRSTVGTLAVKGATLTIDFDMSSLTREGADGASLRILPGTLGIATESQSRQTTWSNHATLTVEIVSVLEDAAPEAPPAVRGVATTDRPVVVATGGVATTGHGPAHVADAGGTPPPAGAGAEAERLAALLHAVEAALGAATLDDPTRAAAQAELKAIAIALQDGRIDEARAGLTAFAQRYIGGALGTDG